MNFHRQFSDVIIFVYGKHTTRRPHKILFVIWCLHVHFFFISPLSPSLHLSRRMFCLYRMDAMWIGYTSIYLSIYLYIRKAHIRTYNSQIVCYKFGCVACTTIGYGAHETRHDMYMLNMNVTLKLSIVHTLTHTHARNENETHRIYIYTCTYLRVLRSHSLCCLRCAHI